jgi:hypothetical protein
MGNFIENGIRGIGDAVSGLFGGSRGSGSSRGVGQQVQDAAKQKAMEDRYSGDLTEDQMNELRAKSIFNSPNVASGRGMVSGMKKGGSVSASSRGDGIAQRGKTKGRMC